MPVISRSNLIAVRVEAPIASKVNVAARRLSIHKDRMRELKDGGDW